MVMVKPSPTRRPSSSFRCRRRHLGSLNSAGTSGGDPMKTVSDLKVAIFADGAEKAGMLEMYAKPYIKGFTTNPTLMRKAGICDYERFAHDILQEIPDRPISFEVFADDFSEMARQARKIATWGKNVRVKIPITNTRRESSVPLCKRLTQDGISLNVTAILTLGQVQAVVEAVKEGADLCIRVCGSHRRYWG